MRSEGPNLGASVGFCKYPGILLRALIMRAQTAMELYQPETTFKKPTAGWILRGCSLLGGIRGGICGIIRRFLRQNSVRTRVM